MKIILTGHKGFLGSNIIKAFQAQHDITGISRTKSNSGFQIKEFISSELNQVVEKPDVVILCHAAVSSGNNHIETKELYESNVSFTDELIKQFPDAYFLFISSISVYGNQEKTVNEHSSISPLSEYAISKLWGEQIVKKTKGYGILRFSSLYGENMKENTIIPNYVNQAIENGVIEVWGNGERQQNYFHVSDAVSYIDKMIVNQYEGVFLGTSLKEVSNKELANIIAKELGSKVKFIESDNSFSLAFDNKSSREFLEITSEKDLELGIIEYINWKQKQF